MTGAQRMTGGFVLGCGWGAASSLANQAVSQAGVVASMLLNSGCAWAGVAVAAGLLAPTRTRGAIAGVLALFATTTAYYATDSVLRHEAFASYWYEMRLWWLASLVLGAVLGAVGASIRRPGWIGLVAGLTVPIGAALEMLWLPRWSRAEPGLGWTRGIIWTLAAVGVGVVVVRFLRLGRVGSGTSPQPQSFRIPTGY